MSDEPLVADPGSDRGYRRSPELQEAFDAAAAQLLSADPWTNVDGSRPSGSPELRADLALEGGGVKGIGLAGAVLVLDEAGYKIQRVAGTSAGAIAAALIAAIVQRGRPITHLRGFLDSLRFEKFMPEGKLHHFLDHLAPGSGEALEAVTSLTHRMGLYSGDYLYEWLGPILGDTLDVHNFGDLRLDPALDPEMSLAPERRYRLVVHTSDVTRGELARLPWDYNYYGRDRDAEPVIDAVRASMSIPFFFEPVTVVTGDAVVDVPAPEGTISRHYRAGQVTWVDGGLLRNFPIDAFDRSDGRAPRWPTIGIKLSSLQTDFGPTEACAHSVGVGVHCLHTMMNEWDRYNVEASTAARTIFVDNAGLKATDFNLSPQQRTELFLNGVKAATQFVINMGSSGRVPRTAAQATVFQQAKRSAAAAAVAAGASANPAGAPV